MERIIRDVMHRGVVTCGVNANAAEAAKIMGIIYIVSQYQKIRLDEID